MEPRLTDTGDGTPKRIGRYEVVRPLSKGGMALVYEARKAVLGGVAPRVAIKIILPDYADSSTFRDLFINEARLGAALQHQNLVQILDFDQDGNRYFLVMEYVDGLTLSKCIALAARHNVPVPMLVACEIGRQACEGLHYLHQAVDPKGRALNMIHRDIKPSNLMVTSEGGVKILDFGISKGRLRAERTGSVKGTWGYMAPEQAQGARIAPNADVFSLGIVLYEMVSRKSMFKGRSEDEIRSLLERDHAARLVQSLEPSYAPLAAVLQRSLQVDPLQRHATAAELGRNLADILPDPITVRDEMSRFYDRIQELARQERVASAVRTVDQEPSSAQSARKGLFTLDAPDDLDAHRTITVAAIAGMVAVVLAFLIGYAAWRTVGASGPGHEVAARPFGGGDVAIVPTPDLPKIDGGVTATPSRPELPPTGTLGEGEAWLRVGCDDCVSIHLDGVYVDPAEPQVLRVLAGKHQLLWREKGGPVRSLPVDVEAGESSSAYLDRLGQVR